MADPKYFVGINMKHIDLFSGIGGFALAARWAGIETVQFVEIDPFCQKVLRKNFPGVPIHDDIKTYEYPTNNTAIDGLSYPFLLTGGFPCQPFSCAGKRRGKEDDRYLWPEMLRVVSEAKPTWIIGENVAGFINMGLDDCISDMETQGYEVQAFVIPACAVNAPHRRDRVWIVGYGGKSDEQRLQEQTERYMDNKSKQPDRHAPDPNRLNGDDAGHDAGEISQQQEAEVCGGDAADTGKQGLEKREMLGCDFREEREATIRGPWKEGWFEAATRLCRISPGVPGGMDRVNRLKALGNAVVPQVVYQIIRAIVHINHLDLLLPEGG